MESYRHTEPQFWCLDVLGHGVHILKIYIENGHLNADTDFFAVPTTLVSP